EIHERELARLVARRALGLLEPRHRIVELALLHQVHADVVVGVAKVGVDLDRLQALRRRIFEPALERVGPTEERVGLSRRTHGQRAAVERDGLVEVARHLATVRLPPQLDCVLEIFRVAHRTVFPRSPASYCTRREPAPRLASALLTRASSKS